MTILTIGVSAYETCKWSGRFSFVKPNIRQLGDIVFGIIFDQLGIFCRLTDFVIGNISFHSALQSMAGKLEFSSRQVATNLLQSLHQENYTCIIKQV